MEPPLRTGASGLASVLRGPGIAILVPMLRNPAETAPYFHHGSVAMLPELVRVTSQHQLGSELAEREVTAIVTWLQSPGGQLPKHYFAQPQLPTRNGGKDRT